MKQKEKWAIEWLSQDSRFEGVDEYHIDIWIAGFESAKKQILRDVVDWNSPRHFETNASPLIIEQVGEEDAK